MHSPSPQIVKESKNLCQPSGASERSGTSGALLSHSPSSIAIGARNCRFSTRSRRCSRKARHRASRGGLILTAAMVLADGVDDLLRNPLRFLGARLGFFEAGVKLPQSLLG